MSGSRRGVQHAARPRSLGILVSIPTLSRITPGDSRARATCHIAPTLRSPCPSEHRLALVRQNVSAWLQAPLDAEGWCPRYRRPRLFGHVPPRSTPHHTVADQDPYPVIGVGNERTCNPSRPSPKDRTCATNCLYMLANCNILGSTLLSPPYCITRS